MIRQAVELDPEVLSEDDGRPIPPDVKRFEPHGWDTHVFIDHLDFGGIGD